MSQAIEIIHRTGIDSLAEIVQHANSPTCPSGMLEINPAFGCEFRCAYCGIYALEKEYYGQVIVYDDYPAYLDRWLCDNPAAIKKNFFYFSAKTDCFQDALLEGGVTLSILQVLRKHGARYFLVTKAGLPPQEIQEELVTARELNQVIVSATMPTEPMRKGIEPGAAPLADRLALASFCVENEIFATASCCPILPISDFVYLKDVFAKLSAVGITHFYFDFARLSRQAVLNLTQLIPEHRDAFERHYFAPEARVSSWHLPHRNKMIDKFQPPQPFMLEAFKTLKACITDVAPHATVSVCNHFATAQTLPGFNDRARAECISCIGHRFA
ncbi:MAG: radical SAM family protein [Planctomycetota bacterium]|jgi:DNA repair photolyase